MRRRTTQLTLGILASVFAALPARADVIKQQPPCPAISCAGLVSNGTVTARSFTFNAPRRGKAIVSFQGVLYCLNNNPNQIFIFAESQIVENNATPSAGGPSGLDYQQAVPAATLGSGTESFNLSSTRVFNINGAGARTFQFRVTAGSIPANAGCSVRHGAFLVHFVDRD
jgi:hypothetical protein